MRIKCNIMQDGEATFCVALLEATVLHCVIYKAHLIWFMYCNEKSKGERQELHIKPGSHFQS